MQKTEQPDLHLKELPYFTCTEHHWKNMWGTYTDGVRYIAQNGYAWLLSDAQIVIRMKPKLRREPFLVIELKVNLEEHTAKMIITDGNNNTLYRQQYNYTDAKRNIKLYYENGVMLLPSER